jgi:hypothetical protein
VLAGANALWLPLQLEAAVLRHPLSAASQVAARLPQPWPTAAALLQQQHALMKPQRRGARLVPGLQPHRKQSWWTLVVGSVSSSTNSSASAGVAAGEQHAAAAAAAVAAARVSGAPIAPAALLGWLSAIDDVPHEVQHGEALAAAAGALAPLLDRWRAFNGAPAACSGEHADAAFRTGVFNHHREGMHMQVRGGARRCVQAATEMGRFCGCPCARPCPHRTPHAHPSHTRTHTHTHTNTHTHTHTPHQSAVHRAGLPLAQGILAILRLSTERFFVLLSLFVSFVLFRTPPRPVAWLVRLNARLTIVFVRVVLYSFPLSCWVFQAGLPFSLLVSRACAPGQGCGV